MPPHPLGKPATLPPEALRHLREMRFWFRCVSVLAFVGGGMLLLMPVTTLLLPLLGGRASGPDVAVLLLGALFFLCALQAFFPAVFLHRSARALAFRTAGFEDAAVEAMRHLKAFWKFTGVMAGFYLFMEALLILAGLATLVFGRPGGHP